MIPWEAPVATGPVEATVAVPGSKSASARALILAALADGPGEVVGLLSARDTQLMRGALQSLGAHIVGLEPGRVGVTPLGEVVGGTRIDCGLSGTVMRFVPPLAALASADTFFHGDLGAEARPVAPLLGALAELGARVSGERLPFSVGGPIRGGRVSLDSSASSQFVSALLLAGCRYPGGLEIEHRGGSLPSLPHIAMTVDMLAERGVYVAATGPTSWAVAEGAPRARIDHIEPDLTNAATLAAAAVITGGRVRTLWPVKTVQAGAALLEALAAFGADCRRDGDHVTVTGGAGPIGADVDLHQVSEITCVAAALAALATGGSRIRGVAHIRGHETDRLAALAREINALGGRVTETPDGLRIEPVPLRGGTFHTYADHRMAHAGALLGLRVPGVILDDVACTTKTLPDFPALWRGLLGVAA